MKKLVATGAVVAALAFGAVGVAHWANADEAKKPLVHSVYFSLKDASPSGKTQFLAGCQKYLTNHPGTLYFAAGPIASELERPVNDRDFDVALLIVFADKKAHDDYQVSERHQDFIKEAGDRLAKVRVFDSYVER